MKLIDDKKIVSKVKETTNYNIKLTSSEILNSFNIEKDIVKEEVKKEKKKKKITLVSLLSSGGLVATAAILLIVLLPNSNKPNGPDNPPINGFIGVSESTELANELITFSGFNNVNNEYQRLKKRLDRDNNSNNISNEDFKNIVNEFDNVFMGIESIFNINNINIKDDHFDDVINNETYKYKTTISDINNNIVGEFYYNDLNKFTDDDETRSYLEAYYETNGDKFNVYLNQEIEQDGDYESELEAIFIPLNSDNYVYKVEKESEAEGNETENQYAYSYYSSINDIHDDDRYLYKVEYEIESNGHNEELEISVNRNEVNNIHEYNFLNIRQIDELHYSFYIEYENEITDEEYELTINLEISGDNHIYTYNDLEVIL